MADIKVLGIDLGKANFHVIRHNDQGEMAAWLGLTPRQHSTGGRQKLLGISKRGNKQLRCLLVHCARSILRFKHKYSDTAFGAWITLMQENKTFNLATVALANKLARIAWAILYKNEEFKLA